MPGSGPGMTLESEEPGRDRRNTGGGRPAAGPDWPAVGRTWH